MRRRLYSGLMWCLLAVWAGPAWGHVLPNGLSVEEFSVQTDRPALVGGTVTVSLTIKNLSAEALVFDQAAGVFVAVRIGGLSDADSRDCGHAFKGKALGPDQSLTVQATLKLDKPGTWRFWPGFKVNGFFGPSRWLEQTLEVYADRVAAAEADKPLSVSSLLAEPARYDKKQVNVVAEAFVVRKKTDRQKRAWVLISLCDPKDRKKVITAFAWGRPEAGNGDIVRVSGVFKMKSKRGRYTYDNEIDALQGAVELVKKGGH